MISREYLLDLSKTPEDYTRFYTECIIADIKLEAQEGKTTYMSPRFSKDTIEICKNILHELCQTFPDVHIFTMRDARTPDTYIILDWTTEYVYMYDKE
jgi:hypothetical protein